MTAFKARTDLFQDRKGIHVKISKTIHAELRARLFQHNISMQNVFDEFARLIITDDIRANKIIEQLVMRKLKESCEGPSKAKKRKSIPIDDLDHDALYNMIENGVDDNDDNS
jgi:predicted GNAT family N-acyltransferase